MYTVVIAEKEHLDRIQEKESFLRPFIDKQNIAFCQWVPREKDPLDSVPTLEQTVRRQEKWRAVILCTQDGLHQKNPFDMVEYSQPKREFDYAPMDEPTSETPTGKAKKMNLEEVSDVEEKILNEKLKKYLTELKRAKFKAYAQASEQPLTRLVTALCTEPMVSEGINHADDDPEFKEYLEEQAEKQRWRRQIMGESMLKVTKPTEVLCISMRNYENPQYDIPVAWTPHVDLHYSKFGDRNLYFDRMRYFVFDILPRDHRNYAFDYLRFLYATLILAGHELGAGTVRPGILYRLDCVNDEDALDRMLSNYASKLNATIVDLQEQIGEIESRQKVRLTDRQARAIFCGNVEVPLIVDQELDQTGLYADSKAYKLSGDCPCDEKHVWGDQLRLSQKTLKLFLKQPKRALRKATEDLRQVNKADCDQALLLNDLQVEDVEEHIHTEEKRMVEVDTPSLYDTTPYDEQMAQEDERIRGILDTRMTKRITLAVGVVALLLFFIGFVPSAVSAVNSGTNVLVALLIALGASALLAIACLFCLLCLRGKVRKGIGGFNSAMLGIHNLLTDGMRAYSTFLSRACNVMRGYSVLKYREKNLPGDVKSIRILKKHIGDLQETYAELEETFGRYISGKNATDGVGVKPYAFDFSRPVDYTYRMPYDSLDARKVEFIQPGNVITLPVSFVTEVLARREEFYD